MEETKDIGIENLRKSDMLVVDSSKMDKKIKICSKRRLMHISQ